MKINEEMFKEFLLGKYLTVRDCVEAWESFKTTYNPPKNEWEVVELKHACGNIISYDEGNEPMYSTRNSWLGNFLSLPTAWAIYKVRRLSDETLLEVGKEYKIKVDDSNGIVGVLNSINWKYETAYFGNSQVSVPFKLKHITSIVECKEVIWRVYTEGNVYETYTPIQFSASVLINNEGPIKEFATEAAAEFFIKEHNPNKSLAMIREALKANRWDGRCINETIEAIEAGLTKLKAKNDG